MTNVVFEQVPIQENYDPMVNMAEYPFVIAPMYHEWNLSDSKELWVRKAVADQLVEIQEKHLEPMGRKFKIWDPWRSRVVQNNVYEKYWNELKEEHPDWDDEKLAFQVGIFVTHAKDPKRIPPHATGGAIDLTVIDAEGNELDFGTTFDWFGPEAKIDYFEKNPGKNDVARDNRRWLHGLIKQYGFNDMEDEWWHIDKGTQLSAVEQGLEFAVYGEVTDPIEFNKEISFKRI